MKIRPLHDRIMVRRLDEETKTAGGLFIPDSAKEKPIQATVIAVGAGKRDKDGKLIALEVKAGDRVLFGKYSGTEVKIDGDEHLILREDDLHQSPFPSKSTRTSSGGSAFKNRSRLISSKPLPPREAIHDRRVDPRELRPRAAIALILESDQKAEPGFLGIVHAAPARKLTPRTDGKPYTDSWKEPKEPSWQAKGPD